MPPAAANEVPMHCERCETKIDPKRAVFLELDCTTALFHGGGGIPAEGESQGWFPFGPDCARTQLRETKKKEAGNNR